MQIEYREPVESDVEALIELAFRFKDSYLEDGAELDGSTFALKELEAKRALVFTLLGRPIGWVDFTDVNRDLSAYIHFTIDPKHAKQFLAEKVYLDVLLDRFRTLKVKKFTAVINSFSTAAQKLAKRMGFYHFATFHEEIYHAGNPMDVYFYSLTRKDLAKALAQQFVSEELEPVPEVTPINEALNEWDKNPVGERPAPDSFGNVWKSAKAEEIKPKRRGRKPRVKQQEQSSISLNA